MHTMTYQAKGSTILSSWGVGLFFCVFFFFLEKKILALDMQENGSKGD